MTDQPLVFPLPERSASRIGLTRVNEHSTWSFGPGSLGDHPGIAYYRFVPIPQTPAEEKEYATKFVQAVARRFSQEASGSGTEPWHEACRTHAARLLAGAEAFRAQGRTVRTGERTTATRLLVGMGYKNALEVGLTFHHPGGFPYLPGTGIKGLARAWAEQVLGFGGTPDGRATLKRIFGSESKDVAETAGAMVAGSVVFLDAVPVRFPPLAADLLNPHVGAYYGDDTGRTAPADWLSPVPVPFLAVGEGATFRFALVSRTEANDDPGTQAAHAAQAARDVETAWGWLMAALTDLGAGGKTAAGYGYFAPEAGNAADTIPALPDTAASTKAPSGEARPTRQTLFATDPVALRAGLKDIPAVVVEIKDRKAWVQLHALGVDGRTFKMEGSYRAEGFPPGTKVLVEVWKEEWDKKKGEPRQVRFQKNFG